MSAKIIYYAAYSADGHIAAVDGGVGWLDSFGKITDYGYHDFFASIDQIVMGRKTYDQTLGFGDWPYADKSCWVFSQRPLEQPSPRVKRFDGSPRQWVDSLPAGQESRVWILGGGALAASFAAADLVDEYQLFQMPCVLGRGVPLFDKDGAEFPSAPQDLSLLECRPYADGVVQLHYRRERSDRAG